MIDIVMYSVAPLIIFVAGYGVGFFIGKLKYNPNIPEPNYLGGHQHDERITRMKYEEET
jgi:hypothetical protein